MCGRDITIRNKDEIEHLGKLLFLRDFDKNESEIVKKVIKRMNYFNNPNISVDELLNFAKEDEEYRLILDSYFNCVYNVFKFLLEMKFIELIQLRYEVFVRQQNFLSLAKTLSGLSGKIKPEDEKEICHYFSDVLNNIENNTIILTIDKHYIEFYIKKEQNDVNLSEIKILTDSEEFNKILANGVLLNKILKSYESFKKYREDLVNILEQIKSSKNFDEKIELFKNLNKILTNEFVKSFLNLFKLKNIIEDNNKIYEKDYPVRPVDFSKHLQSIIKIMEDYVARLNEYMKKYSNNKNSNSNS